MASPTQNGMWPTPLRTNSAWVGYKALYRGDNPSLRKRGNLNISDPIQKYMPEAPAAWDQITSPSFGRSCSCGHLHGARRHRAAEREHDERREDKLDGEHSHGGGVGTAPFPEQTNEHRPHEPAERNHHVDERDAARG